MYFQFYVYLKGRKGSTVRMGHIYQSPKKTFYIDDINVGQLPNTFHSKMSALKIILQEKDNHSQDVWNR